MASSGGLDYCTVSLLEFNYRCSLRRARLDLLYRNTYGIVAGAKMRFPRGSGKDAQSYTVTTAWTESSNHRS